jgi:hypothetical protein
MSVCSDDLIALALNLIELDPNSECMARTSVGRSYYALFYEALVAADTLNLNRCPAGMSMATHERLIYRYESGSKGLASLARALRKQKKIRAMADYDIAEDFRAAEARLHIANSTRLIQDLRRISKSEVVVQS